MFTQADWLEFVPVVRVEPVLLCPLSVLKGSHVGLVPNTSNGSVSDKLRLLPPRVKPGDVRLDSIPMLTRAVMFVFRCDWPMMDFMRLVDAEPLSSTSESHSLKNKHIDIIKSDRKRKTHYCVLKEENNITSSAIYL